MSEINSTRIITFRTWGWRQNTANTVTITDENFQRLLAKPLRYYTSRCSFYAKSDDVGVYRSQIIFKRIITFQTGGWIYKYGAKRVLDENLQQLLPNPFRYYDYIIQADVVFPQIEWCLGLYVGNYFYKNYNVSNLKCNNKIQQKT